MTKILSLICMLTLATSYGQTNFVQLYGDNYKQATEYVQFHNKSIELACKQWGADPAMVTAMIFPELIRYNLLRDFFETTALELSYVELGSAGVDFSIGHFQMKPSFVEQLEHYLATRAGANLANTFAHLLQYTATSNTGIRRERLQRLKSHNWQILYACCCYLILEERFGRFAWESEPHKLAFYATAYNCGFYKPKDTIAMWQSKEIFPYGLGQNMAQHTYSEVSQYYYIKNPSRK